MASISLLESRCETKYSSIWVLESTEHNDFADVVVIAGVPEVVDDFFDWGLSEDCKHLAINDRSHQTGIDVEVGHMGDFDPIMFV